MVLSFWIVDSDFCLAQLYYNGQELQECYIGRIYLEIWLQHRVSKPKMKLWLPLLQDVSMASQYKKALRDSSVFVEDQLRSLSELTGLPIFDDELMDAAPEFSFRPLIF